MSEREKRLRGSGNCRQSAQTVKGLFFPDQADHETDDGHDSEQEKEDLCNLNGACGYAAETEDGSDQGDHQKYD
jgi:hypothetical protein